MDLALTWPNDTDPASGDLQIGPDGDLATVAGPTETMQRVIRLLLSNNRSTNPANPSGFLAADDWKNPDYGLGLRRLVGKAFTPNVLSFLKNTILNALASDPGVQSTPAPTIAVTAQPGGGSAMITFTPTGTAIPTSFPLLDLTQ